MNLFISFSTPFLLTHARTKLQRRVDLAHIRVHRFRSLVHAVKRLRITDKRTLDYVQRRRCVLARLP